MITEGSSSISPAPRKVKMKVSEKQYNITQQYKSKQQKQTTNPISDISVVCYSGDKPWRHLLKEPRCKQT